MKKTVSIMVLIVLSASLHAQIFYGGITAGISGNQIDGDESSGYNKAGLIGGVFVGTDVGDNTSLDIELYYIGKGALLNEKRADGTVFQVFKSHLRYVEMPLLYSWHLHEKFSLSGGIAPAYFIASNLYSMGSLVSENTYSMKDFDFSPMGKVDFHFSKTISINVRFSYSLMTVRNDIGWFNNNLSIAARYYFGQ